MCFFAIASTMNAQLVIGDKLNGNVTGEDVVTGEAVDLQAWLDEGKSVVVDVFATWCGPCWTFHATGWLDEYNERYGPDGTDQIRILGVEADGNTPVSAIMTNQFGQPGDWVTSPETGEPISYNLIDAPTANGTLNIAYFPTLYIFRPDGTVVEVGSIPGGRYDENFWDSALGINDEANLRMVGSLPNLSICQDLEVSGADVEIYNVSQNTAISSGELELSLNGEVVQTVIIDTEIPPFSAATVEIPSFTVSEASELTFAVGSLNGNAASIEQELTGNVGKFEIATEKMTVLFTTDNYPGETSWTLEDDLGNSLAGASYAAGPGQAGAGGVDAFQTFEYEVEIGTDVSCLNFVINDSYGDGLVSWDPSQHEPPGFELVDQWGNYVKDNIVEFNADGSIADINGESFFRFSSTEGSINAEQTTSVESIGTLSTFNTFPNPVYDNLTVELAFNENVDFQMFITDALGNKVKTLGQFSESNMTQNINVTDLASGVYSLSIMTKDGQNVSKFVKM